MLIRFMYLTLIFCITYQAIAVDGAFIERHSKAVAENPEGVTFTISTENGQNVFHMGEKIPITLSFSSSASNTYSLLYRDANRTQCDTFFLNPSDGAINPLHWFYRMDGMFWPNGFDDPSRFGIKNYLLEEPSTLQIILNEWMRFEKPGVYELYAASERVHRCNKSDKNFFVQHTPLPLVSNIIQLEILPDDLEWKRSQFQSAMQIIQSTTDRPTLESAYQILRFLDIEETIDPLTDRLTNSVNTNKLFRNCAKGLYASPFKKLVLDRMKARIDDPTVTIQRPFLERISYMACSLKHPDLLPTYSPDDEEAKQKHFKLARERSDSFRNFRIGYVKRMAEVRSNNEAVSKTRCLMICIDFLRSTSPEQLTEWQKKIIEEFPQVVKTAFHQLTTAEQSHLISNYDEYLTIPEMLPIYLDVYRNTKWSPHGSTSSLLDGALTRIYQLDPEQGRKLILDEIQRSQPRVSLKCLDLLPDPELPGVDRIVTSHLASCFQTSWRTEEIHVDGMKMRGYIQTLERFGSPEVFEDMKGVYFDSNARKEHVWDEIAALLLSYFLRVDEPFAVKLIEDLVQDKDIDGSSILRRISQIRPHPILERFIIPYLEDRDSQKVYYTVSWLDRNGTLACKQPLWNCLERWSKQWRGKEGELTTDDLHSDVWFQNRIGAKLIAALTYQPCWMLNLEELKQIQPMCLTESMKKCVGECIKNYGKPLTLSISTDYRSKKKPRPVNLYIPMRSNYVHYGKYTQEMVWNKLAQHPKGTIFEYRLGSELKEREAAPFVQKLRQYLEGMGMILRKKGD